MPRIRHGVVRETKPHVSIERVLQEFYGMIVGDEEIIVVGDNPKSDMQLALIHGYRGLYAKYGRHEKQKELIETLLLYTQGPIATRNVNVETNVEIPASCTPISSFREVPRYVLQVRT